jgi:hypothetical protein
MRQHFAEEFVGLNNAELNRSSCLAVVKLSRFPLFLLITLNEAVCSFCLNETFAVNSPIVGISSFELYAKSFALGFLNSGLDGHAWKLNSSIMLCCAPESISIFTGRSLMKSSIVGLLSVPSVNVKMYLLRSSFSSSNSVDAFSLSVSLPSLASSKLVGSLVAIEFIFFLQYFDFAKWFNSLQTAHLLPQAGQSPIRGYSLPHAWHDRSDCFELEPAYLLTEFFLRNICSGFCCACCCNRRFLPLRLARFCRLFLVGWPSCPSFSIILRSFHLFLLLLRFRPT